MSEVQTFGRSGEVVRIAPHGTIIIWDSIAKRAYPFYKAGREPFRLGELVRFNTDATDTIVTSLRKLGSSGQPKHLRRHKGRRVVVETRIGH